MNPDPHPSLRDALDVTRFWSLVQRRGDEECWDWSGCQDDAGYGMFQWHGKMVGAHALAVSFTTGELRGDGLETLHSCDNPPCCNPRHLRFGTRQENVNDMLSRNRGSKPNIRLTDDQVREIRERRQMGARQSDLATQYGVTDGWISGIVRGLKRRDAGGPIETERKYKRGK